jgi:predicted ATPase
MRIGLNTGPVLLGEIGTTREFTAMGDTVNVASRLQNAAPLNGVLIAHDTYRHVRGVFDVQPLGPMTIRGKTDPLPAYLVEREKPRAFHKGGRGIEGIETRTIGREAELARLQEIYNRVLEERTCQVVTVVGEAGVGKSRLVFEFENWLELRPETIYYFTARAEQERQGLPYALLRDLFAYRFEIQESDPLEVVWEKIERGFSDTFEEYDPGEARLLRTQQTRTQLGADRARLRAHLVGQLLGFDFSASPHVQALGGDARQLRDRAVLYMIAYFQALAVHNPVLLMLEDIHWADDSSLDVLHRLALAAAAPLTLLGLTGADTAPGNRFADDDLDSKGVPGTPLFIVAAGRPTLYERRPQWDEALSSQRLDLRPLSPQDSRRLVDEILQRVEQVPEALYEQVVAGAEGNPFYLEELVKILIEDGVIVKSAARWQVDLDRLSEVRVPATLTAIVQARMDSLPSSERTTLQQAAVVGRQFWDAALCHIGTAKQAGTTPAGVQTNLAALRNREMVFLRKRSTFAGAREYIFKHAISRKVAYESILKRVRRDYHRLVAAWLIQQGGGRAEEYTGLIAEHLQLGEELAQAAVYLRRAGEQAAARYAHAEAASYLGQALALTSEEDAAGRYGLLLARERAYDMQGARSAQTEDLLWLRALAADLADPQRQAEVALRQSHYAEVTGDYPAALAASREAVESAQACGDTGREAAGRLYWGQALYGQGEYAAAREQLEQALAQTTGRPDLEAGVRRNLGKVCWSQGEHTLARKYYEQARHLCRQIGDRQGESLTLISLSTLNWSQHDYTAARNCLEQALEVCREIGDRRGECGALNNLGTVSWSQGDYTAARAYYEQSWRITSEIGELRGQGLALNNLGLIGETQGDYATAQGYYERALEIRRAIGDRQGESLALHNLGAVCAALGDYARAQGYYQQALRIAREIGDRSIEGYALTAQGRALAGLGRFAEAAAACQKAVALRRQSGEKQLVLESLAVGAGVSLARGDVDEAQRQAEEVLDYLQAGGALEGTEEPLRIYLLCYRVLRAVRDPGARKLLATAHALLQEKASRILDTQTRRSFLENVPTHREILAEFGTQT